ncbi:MAG TPA: DUF2442 domain-containing protein [Parafilimonas sp.]|jgi:hypothetical protein|nr:DUF2442 domain-containing protein [Parafilimonas sp.]
MNSSMNKYDSIENLINDENLRIEKISFHPEQDEMLITLSTKAILHQRISSYKRLQNATKDQLNNYELIGAGTGIHWNLLDEDLSLKGFLRDELKNVIKGNNAA